MHPIARLFGIFVVFCIAGLGWLGLAGVTSSRTSGTGSELSGRVADLWGTTQSQAAPTFTQRWYTPQVTEKVTDHGKERTTEMVQQLLPMEPSSSRINVDLELDSRRKGLIWFPLYNVTFDGVWTYVHHGEPRILDLAFAFPDSTGVYESFHFLVDGVDQGAAVKPQNGQVGYAMNVVEGQTVTLAVGYRSRGQNMWMYRPSASVGNIADFQLDMTTDFAAIDFPQMTLSPSNKVQTDKGWSLTWAFPRVVTGYGIGMVMPEPVQPGELATELAITAPLSLGFFFLWIFAIGVLRKIEVHPINYLFLAGAFFAFDLLFSYTADRLPVEQAFALASVTSVFLVVSYLRLVVGPRFAFVEAGLAQLLYQVGFALAHFWEGFTGLTITVLAVVTLFALMQMTGRVKWAEVLAEKPKATPQPQ